MWAEISIKTKGQLPQNITESCVGFWGAGANAMQVINDTVFAGNPDFANHVVYAFKSNDKVFLVFRDDIRALRIHIESVQSKDRFDQLDKAINTTFEAACKFLKENNLRMDKSTASIFAETSFLIKGDYVTKTKIFLDTLKKDVTLKVYIPLVTLVVSYLMQQDWQKSLFNAMVAVAATLLWLMIETVKSKEEIKYSLNK